MAADGGAGDRWTAEHVGEAVIEAFRMLPSMPVYSPRRAEFVPVLSGQDPSPLDVVALSEHVLGRSTPERRILLIWARSMATGGDVGGSIRQYCVERDMNRNTFDRRRKRACVRIATEMNRSADAAARASAGDDLRCASRLPRTSGKSSYDRLASKGSAARYILMRSL